MGHSTYTYLKLFYVFIFIGILMPSAWTQRTANSQKTKKTEYPKSPDNLRDGKNRSTRNRVVKVGREDDGSVFDGLRSEHLLKITLPWTLGMLGFVILLLYCMRTDGWLFHLFTDDYVPPATKKRMEEEARRAEGRKVRRERVDNWTELRRTWETDLKESTQRIRATMPPNVPPTSNAHCPPQKS